MSLWVVTFSDPNADEPILAFSTPRQMLLEPETVFGPFLSDLVRFQHEQAAEGGGELVRYPHPRRSVGRGQPAPKAREALAARAPFAVPARHK